MHRDRPRVFDTISNSLYTIYAFNTLLNMHGWLTPYLHLTINHPGILSLSIDMMNLCQIVFLPECGVEDMVQVHRQDVKEPRGSSCVDSVAGVVRVSPGIGPVRQASVGEQVQYLLVRVVLATQEDEMFQRVRQTIIISCLCGQAEVTIDNGRLCLGQDNGQPCQVGPVLHYGQAGA